jgi:hypothetical protein
MPEGRRLQADNKKTAPFRSSGTWAVCDISKIICSFVPFTLSGWEGGMNDNKISVPSK